MKGEGMKGFKYILALTVFSVGMIISGCSTNRVYSDYVEGLNFQQFQSFAWLPSQDTAQQSLYENEIVMQNLRNLANNEMQRRGYNIDTKNPDLLLLMRVNFEEREELVRTPIYSSYSYYYPGFYVGPGYPYYYSYYNTIPSVSGYDIRSVEFTQGTVVIDMVRAETNELVWRGWTQTQITDPDDFKKELKDVIEDIFDKYPVEEKKK